MESFSSYYDPDISTKRVYSNIQSIQSLLFFDLIIDTPCSSNVLPVIYVDEKNYNINTDSLKNMNEYADKRFIVSAIIYDLKAGAHYGSALFDTENKTFSIFDSSRSGIEYILHTVEKRIEDTTGYKYVDIPCFISFQQETRDYYCSLWSFMIMYLSCQEEGNISNIVKYVSSLSKEKKRAEIEGFIHFLYKRMIDMKLLDDAYRANRFIYTILSDKNVDSSSRYDIIRTLMFSSNRDKFMRLLDRYSVGQSEGEGISSSPIFPVYTMLRSIVNDTDTLSFIENLSHPMSMSDYMDGIDKIYSNTGGPDEYMPITIYNILKYLYSDIDQFIPVLKNISFLVQFSFNITDIQKLTDGLSIQFSKYSGIPLGEYKMWNFIFEFYLRYYILDTYDLKSGDDPMIHRSRVYESLIIKSKISDKWMDKIDRIMIFSPVKYIRMIDFISSLSSDPDNETIAEMMASNSLIKTDTSYQKYYDRVMNMLDPEWNLYG